MAMRCNTYGRSGLMSILAGVLLITPSIALAAGRAPTVLPGEISKSETLTVAHSPYLAHDNVTVDNKAILTIQPGVVIKFDQGAGLTIGSGGSPGFLIAKGVKPGANGAEIPAPIHFLASLPNPTHGYWRGIEINNSQYRSIMDHCDISNAGADGAPAVKVDGGNAPTITNCSITWGDGDGVNAEDGDFTRFDGNTIAHFKGVGMSISPDSAGGVGPHNKLIANGHDYIKVNGTVDRDSHWTNNTVPFFSDNGLKVEAATQDKAATLTLDPGVQISFAKGQILTLGWNNLGSLVANGTADRPVLFTGAPSWAGINGAKAGNVTLEHCIVELSDADHPALSVSSGAISITDSIIRNGAAVGFHAEGDNTKITAFHGNTVTGMKGAPVELEARLAYGIEPANTLTGNGQDFVVLKNATVNQDAEWKFGAIPFYAPAGITVESSSQTTPATLTLDPGVQISFAKGQNLTLGWNNVGSLVANGTADHPVLFTGAPDWAGINGAKAGNVTLDHCTIEMSDAGNPALNLTTGNISITNSTIRNGAGVGFHAEGDNTKITAFHGNTVTGMKGAPVELDAHLAYGIEPANTITGNSQDFVFLKSAAVNQDEEWKFTAVPFYAPAGITVEGPSDTTPATLTLDPGVQIQFGDDQKFNLGWNNQGNLKAVATADKPILLTSHEKTPGKGDWTGIAFNKSGSDTDLENVQIEYAGKKDGDAAVNLSGNTRGDIHNCTIAHCGNGLNQDDSRVKVDGLQFQDVDSGTTVKPAQ
ncbi:MAG TPA: right-handed parallel beta-helix repeat-containing protein [Armatimonadota bacterium]|nr:right-handed parallel beta-helix repeat-containing protein [Armatimonadota bacterium]